MVVTPETKKQKKKNRQEQQMSRTANFRFYLIRRSFVIN